MSREVGAVQDSFISYTIYDSLWDALIVRIGAIWDDTKDVASLPKLAKEIKRSGSQSARDVARRIDIEKSSAKEKIVAFRNKAVAHKAYNIDSLISSHGGSVTILEARQVADNIEDILGQVRNGIGEHSVSFAIIKKDAEDGARQSLDKWVAGHS